MPVEAATWLLLSLGFLGGTLGTLSWLYYRLRGIEAELRETREKVSRLEAENKLLERLLGEREERIKLLQHRVEKLEEQLASLEDKVGYLQSIALSKEALQSQDQAGRGELEELDQELIDLKILALYKQGYSIRQIAKEVGLSKSTVHRRLRKLLEKKNIAP